MNLCNAVELGHLIMTMIQNRLVKHETKKPVLQACWHVLKHGYVTLVPIFLFKKRKIKWSKIWKATQIAMYLWSKDDRSIQKGRPRAEQVSSSTTTYARKQQCCYVTGKKNETPNRLGGGTLGRQKCDHVHRIYGNMASGREPSRV